MKSIAVKLWLGITAIVLMILVMIWGFQVGLLKEFYIRERQASLVLQNEELADRIVEEVPSLEFDDTYLDTIDSYSEHLNVRMLIIDTDYQIKYVNFAGIGKNSVFPPDLNISRINQRPDKPPEFSDDERLDQPEDASHSENSDVLSDRVLAGLQRQLSDLNIDEDFFEDAPFVREIVIGHPRNTTIVSVQPIVSNGEILGHILMHTPVAPIEETIATLKKQLTIISVVSILFATLVAFAYAAVSIKPLRRLEEATKRIATGDFTTRVMNVSEDEIGQLGRSINHMAEELGKIEEFRRDFIANVTHELKTPISLISAYAELVKEIPDLDKVNCDRHMLEIIEESERLNSIVEEILYLSKLESNNLPLNMATFAVEGVVEEVVESLTFAAAKKQITMAATLDPDLRIFGDREKIYQIFYNLISNGIHHCNTGAEIRIEQIELPTFTRIEVVDNGPGIAPHDLPYIWDRFYKVDKSGKRNATGTGLGMSIVKTILEAHGFKHGIQSSVGSGTTVFFEIPKH